MSEKIFPLKCEDPEEEDPEYTSPCFGINPYVKLKEIPTTGEEYLLKVIKEREKYSKVTKCGKDYSKFAKNQSYFVKEEPPTVAPDKIKPTIEWQNIQVADFSDIRMYISRMVAKKSSWPSDVKNLEIASNQDVEWERFFEDREPTLSCALGLHHSLLDTGIEALIQILGNIEPGNTIDRKTGQWIYAFLACTRQPLLPDTVSIFRNLARKCLEIRSHINPEDENVIEAVAPLNIFICLVARYFGQFDLAD